MVKITVEYERAICLIADLHVGSRYAIAPEKWITREGGSFDSLLNPAQKQLLKHWKDFVYKMRHDFDIDTVIIDGDVCAGTNPRQYARGLFTADLNEQLEAAYHLLEPLCKGLKVVVLNGTPYHESQDFQIHQTLADYFNGEFHGYVSLAKIKPSEKIMFVTHEAPIAPVYPETATARDMMHMFKSMALGKTPKINVIVRAHRHISDYKHKKEFHLINLPCWCCFAPYPKITRYYFLMQPDIGGVLLLLEKKTHRVCPKIFDDYELPHVADRLTTI